ncbi:MAG TPA: hypothetical protein VMM12_19065 [Longimicrobiales bacterium]|nr:hypothetical protein [Longimicrobiales bacterium]
MSSAHESLSDNEAERLLASLAGVVSAHVVTDSIGRIVEIHILSAAGVHPKQVVRNVESALSAGLGIEIDRRIVSVAQIRATSDDGEGADGRTLSGAAEPPGNGGADRTGTGQAPPTRNGAATGKGGQEPRVQDRVAAARLEYVKFHSMRDAELCACDVMLRDGDRLITGRGSGPDTAAGRAEAAARGVLDAIVQARPDVRLELEGAAISASRGRAYVIISATALLDRMTVPLAGAAPLARSPEEAGILAALQATNRWSG